MGFRVEGSGFRFERWWIFGHHGGNFRIDTPIRVRGAGPKSIQQASVGGFRV